MNGGVEKRHQGAVVLLVECNYFLINATDASNCCASACAVHMSVCAGGMW